MYVEVYVPHEAAAGPHKGKLTLKTGGDTLTLDVTLNVWNFTLPDYLSFIPEMNCYGLPQNERDYYRLAQVHRVVLNKVPYHHRGDVEEGCTPVWHGKKARLDRLGTSTFCPYFDGSAFDDLLARSARWRDFTLPLFENWPTPMEGNLPQPATTGPTARSPTATARTSWKSRGSSPESDIRGERWDDHAVPVLLQRQEQPQGERLVVAEPAPVRWTEPVEFPGLLGACSRV